MEKIRLTLRNIGNFTHKDLTLPLANLTIYEDRSAAGKTTVAKVLVSFLTGEVSASLKKSDASEGEASLLYGGKLYRLKIKTTMSVDPIWKNTRYAGMLVLVEGSQTYNYAFSNLNSFDLRTLLDMIIPLPRHRFTRASKESLEKVIRRYRQDLDAIERDIERVKTEIKNLTTAKDEIREVTIDVTPIMRLNEVRNRIADIEKEISKVEEKIALMPQHDQEELRELKSKLAEYEEEKRSLEWKLRTLNEIADGIRTTISGLRIMQKYADVVDELDLWVLDDYLTSERVSRLVSDLEMSLDIVNEQITKVENDLKLITTSIAMTEEKISSIESEIRNYEAVLTQLNNLRETLEKLRAEEASLKAKVKELERKYGKSADEILKEKFRSDEGLRKRMMVDKKIRELEARLRELESERTQIKLALKAAEEQLRDLSQRLQKEEEERARYERARKEAEEKRRKFVDVFMDTFAAAFSSITVPDLDIRKIRVRRPMGTYSHSERMLIGTALLVATAKALESIGVTIPYVVVDVVAPLDPRYETVIKDLLKSIKAPAIMLKTAPAQNVRVET